MFILKKIIILREKSQHSLQSILLIKRAVHAGTNTVKHPLWNLYFHRPAAKQYSESSITKDFSFLKRVDWILKSHHVCMIQTTNTLLLNCEQNAGGGSLWVQFVKAAYWWTCSSGWVNHLLRHAILPQASLLHPFSQHCGRVLSTSSCALTQSERRSSTEQNQKLRFKSKTHIQGKWVWDPTQVIYISDSLSLKKEKKKSQLFFFWSEIHTSPFHERSLQSWLLWGL